MIKKSRRYPSIVLFVLFVVILFCSGCETWKGIQRDYKKMMDWDKEFQENYW